MEKKIYTVMILDDQLDSTKLMQFMLEKLEYLKIVHREDDPIEALKFLEMQPVDILFLDMQMPTMMGWEFVNLLERRPVIIVMSGLGKYGYRANDIGAKGYLRKVPEREVLLRVLKDAIKEVDEIESLTKSGSTYVTLRRYKTRIDEHVEHDQIRYAVVQDKEVTLHLKEGRTLISAIALNALMDLLPLKKFVRINQSEMVSVDEICSYTSKVIHLKDETADFLIQNPEAYRIIDSSLRTGG